MRRNKRGPIAKQQDKVVMGANDTVSSTPRKPHLLPHVAAGRFGENIVDNCRRSIWNATCYLQWMVTREKRVWQCTPLVQSRLRSTFTYTWSSQTYVGVAEAVAPLHSDQVFWQSTEQLVTRSRCAVVTVSRIVALGKGFITVSDREEFFPP